ncbi:mitochondrial 1-pyrroline-5-carboxylate dehydrogenase [Andalucia godoyi]|uniref:Multifunctional fusion protein n=1 Tax=Andalucia godoyi TaxID=505711 RepID=A0A8K0AI80_ANDGO|nr:mitochondrial 1-pyrroline-5-carboxylate dehydrogenase [Andalucia godoyi]|eukprot:ANDGO_02808.mRNA.1 mitochondrial 1-pyrroline-5-carboxylate dehydrogenase
MLTLRRSIPSIHRGFSTMSLPRLPEVKNEQMLDYRPGSAERAALSKAVASLKAQGAIDIPCIVNGKEYFTGKTVNQGMPSSHGTVLARVHHATPAILKDAIAGSLKVRRDWANLPYAERAAVFLQAAEYLSTTDRALICGATVLGQAKTAWQAEIDAAAETIDFWRFSAAYGEQIYGLQPEHHSPGVWNRMEYRPLEGFVFAVSPFNFTAIGSNLVSAPAQMGNVVLWKPSDTAAFSNYYIYKLLQKSGLPDGVVQFLPFAPTADTSDVVLKDKDLAGLHFTGSTQTFQRLFKTIGENIEQYRGYPRIVGETGGKNFHFAHPSADPVHVALQTVRSAFEYSGQKCSACSRLYVPRSIWPAVKQRMLSELAKFKVGQPDDFTSYASAVIDAKSFAKIKSYVEHVRSDKSCTFLHSGKMDDSVGYFVEPQFVETTNPLARTMCEEIFGPFLTAYVYEDSEYEKTMKLAAESSIYSLTGSFFSRDRQSIHHAHDVLLEACGNFYVNDKSTGAVVGQQPFGGARGSGTNDKAGFVFNLIRWTSPRTIKENFRPISAVEYPSIDPVKSA